MQKEQVLKIREIITQTYNVKSFRLETIDKSDYKAGQFAQISLGDSKGLTRYLTLSSSPTEIGHLEITKKLTDSEFSRKLNAARIGDEIKIKYPFGNFTLSEGDKKIAFLSGGIGITPIRSISKYMCDNALNLDVVLIYGNRSSNDIAFKEDFDLAASACGNYKVVHVLSQPEAEWQGRKGRIDSNVIKEEVPDYAERCFYICGPPLMVSGLKCILKDALGIHESNIKSENFSGY